VRLDAALEPTERRIAAKDTTYWAQLVDRMVAECHPEQRDFVLDDGFLIAALVGRGGGKTTGGDVRFLRRMLTTQGARCLFIARTRQHAKSLIWADTKKMFTRLGFVEDVDIIFNETELVATLTRNGSSLQLAGADKLAFLEPFRGISWHEIGIDEGASHPDHIITYLIDEVAGPRLLGALWIVGTAGRRLKGRFYEVTRRGSTESRPYRDREQFPGWVKWSFHKWSLESAIDATRDRPIRKLLEIQEAQRKLIAASGWTDETPAKRREIDAEWASDETINVYKYRVHDENGQIWNQWDPERVGPMRLAKLPEHLSNWVLAVSMDPGFSDPTAINAFAFSYDDPTHTLYHVFCFEQTALYAQLIANLLIGPERKLEEPAGLIGALGVWPNVMVADPAHQMAEAILAELLNVYHIHVEPAQKGYRYKVGAIDVVNGELVGGRIKVLKDSALEDQLVDLQWDESRTGEQIERKGQPNHSADTLVYARAALAPFLSDGAPAPEPPPPSAPDPRAAGYVPPMPRPPADDGLLGDPDYEL
jgi:hypothetical protein